MLLGCCAVVALEIKYKAPKAHTLLELVYVRWGPIAHMVSVLYPQWRTICKSTDPMDTVDVRSSP
jgi:hypothetical protein